MTISETVKATPRYRQAKQFDAFLRGELSPEDRNTLVGECRGRQETVGAQTSTSLDKKTANESSGMARNIFCPSVLAESKIRRFLRKEEKAAEPRLRQKPDPITPTIAGGKVKNWAKIQRANLKAILSGMREFTLDELKTAGRYALTRPECPNHIAIATAALLEIHLPTENVSTDIAKLYEKGARCTRSRTANHEHYLTRAALFHLIDRKPAEAERLLMKVQPVDAYSGRSLYWLARVRTLLGKGDLAEKALSRLKSQFPLSFHALLVRATEKTDPFADEKQDALPTRSERGGSSNSFIEQAETLREMGFAESAAKIVAYALTFHTPRESGVRAYLASLGDVPTQIRTLQSLLLVHPSLRTRPYLALAYPKAYFELFEEFSSKVDPYLMLAVARKESTMDPNAISPANAQGLLQINPDTARRLSGSDSPNLFDPRVSAELASRYLRELRSAMRDQLPLMIASYNAGEQTVAGWTLRYPTTDMVLFIDLIPYRETRDYVGFVLSNYFWYRRLYGDNAFGAIAQLAGGELAKVEVPREVRSIKSLVEEALRTSESWPEEPPATPFSEKWDDLDPPVPSF